MSDAKFKVGDKVVVINSGLCFTKARLETVKRVMKRFVELSDGSKFTACGSDRWPASDSAHRVSWTSIQLFDAAKHQPMLEKVRVRAVRESLQRKLDTLDESLLIQVASEMHALLTKIEELKSV